MENRLKSIKRENRKLKLINLKLKEKSDEIVQSIQKLFEDRKLLVDKDQAKLKSLVETLSQKTKGLNDKELEDDLEIDADPEVDYVVSNIVSMVC